MNNDPKIPVERVTPYASDETKGVQIARAFDALSPRYDALNRVLSLGLDLGWRRRALRLLRAAPPGRLLDVATGTADFALLAARLFPAARITGVDLSDGMVAEGRRKIAAAGLSPRIELKIGNAQALPFSDASFDAVTAAFGVRNFENLTAGLADMRRVLTPGGRAVVLELSAPDAFPLRQLHGLYLRYWIPLIGRLLTGHAEEYAYLPASIERVPQGDAMLDLFHAAGFSDCRCFRYTFGICSCYTGVR